VLEAMAAGLPVVATDVGGTAELVDAGVEGYVVAAGDRDAIVARSLDVLSDPAGLTMMQLAARARAARYGREQMVQATMAVYARAIGQGTA
jgi:glycosyltransferase involved in cell wall biosynthesis